MKLQVFFHQEVSLLMWHFFLLLTLKVAACRRGELFCYFVLENVWASLFEYYDHLLKLFFVLSPSAPLPSKCSSSESTRLVPHTSVPIPKPVPAFSSIRECRQSESLGVFPAEACINTSSGLDANDSRQR